MVQVCFTLFIQQVTLDAGAASNGWELSNAALQIKAAVVVNAGFVILVGGDDANGGIPNAEHGILWRQPASLQLAG